jgi:hypothetical protein
MTTSVQRSKRGFATWSFQPILARKVRSLALISFTGKPILQIVRGQNQCCKEHSTSAHERAVRRAVPRLFHCEVTIRHERLDQDQVVQCDLKRRVACARASERLFDVRAERQDAASGGSLSRAARDHGKWPDDLNHLGSRVFTKDD